MGGQIFMTVVETIALAGMTIIRSTLVDVITGIGAGENLQ